MSSAKSASETPRKYQLFIDGKWVDAESGKTFTTPNPATGETLAEVAEGDKADIDKAVAAARRAFDGKWSKVSARDRGRHDVQARAAHRGEHSPELAALETADNGKPIKEIAYVDLPQVVENFEYFAGWATKIEGETIPVPGQMFNYTLREPVGVCGQIIPWNFPLLMAAWKLAPALAAGNTVVLKPAEQTPVGAMELGLADSGGGLPRRRRQRRPRLRRDRRRGARLAPGHRQGRLHRLDRSRQDHRARGGRQPDESLARTGRQGPQHRLRRRRHRAGRERRDDGHLLQPGAGLLRRLAPLPRREQSRTSSSTASRRGRSRVKVGDPMDKATQMGPQVSEEQLDRIKGYVDIAKGEGATVLAGGVPAAARRRLPEGLLLPADHLRRGEERRCASRRKRFSAPSSPSSPSRTKKI